jgi:hypothetical protein
MQSRLSTHSPDGSVAEDEDVVVCEPLLLVPVFVVVFVFVFVVLSVAVDEEVCSVVVSVVPDVLVVPAPAATDVESVA